MIVGWGFFSVVFFGVVFVAMRSMTVNFFEIETVIMRITFICTLVSRYNDKDGEYLYCYLLSPTGSLACIN